MKDLEKEFKFKCTNHHTFFRYDWRGLHLWCRHCKTVRELSWEELQSMYQETRETSASQHCVL